MSDARTMTFEAGSPDETRAIAERLGRAMRVGDVIALVGGLGAGKTTFAQGLAVGLGVARERLVTSPSFALVNEHPGRVPFVHADVYRVKDEAELAELGIEEACDRAAVAIEWADRFAALLPADHLLIVLEPVGEAAAERRRLRFTANGPRARALASVIASP